MKKPYLMYVTEKKTRQVICWAEDRTEACELIEDLCNKDKIDMSQGDFSRDVFVQFKAQDYDLNSFEQFGNEEGSE